MDPGAGQSEDPVAAAAGLPLEERVMHKNWRVRAAAYDECGEALAGGGERARDVVGVLEARLAKMVVDSNAAAQDKALDVALALVDKYDDVAAVSRIACSLLGGVAEKGLGGRPGTKTRAQNLILLMIEVVDNPNDVVAGLLPSLGFKIAKVPAALLVVLQTALHDYGPRVISPKPLYKVLPKLFEHTDKNVRAGVSALVVELFRWVGPAVRPMVDGLRSAQQKELDAEFEAISPGQAQPEKLTRSQAAKAEAAPAAAAAASSAGAGSAAASSSATPGAGAAAAAAGAAYDAYDDLPATEVLGHIKADIHEGLASKKWSDRTAALDAIIGFASAPRLKNGDYGELANLLKRMLGDSNVVVVAKAITLIGHLGKGLRKDFAHWSRVLLPSLIDKLKDKKSTVVAAVHTALDSFGTHCFSFADASEDILGALASKTPAIKRETLVWIARWMRQTPPPAINSKIGKPLGNSLAKCTEDGAVDVRGASFDAFAAFAKLVGEKGAAPHLEKVEPGKQAKIRQLIDGTGATAPAAAPASSSSSAPSSSSSSASAGPRPSKIAIPAGGAGSGPRSAPAKPAAAPSAASAARTGKTPRTAKAAVSAGSAAPSGGSSAALMSEEELAAQIEETVPAAIASGVQESNWKLRLEAMDALKTEVSEGTDEGISLEVLVRMLAKKPSFKDTNFQVLGRVFDVIGMAAVKAADPANRRVVALVVPGACEKLADIKVRGPAGECLLNLSEASSPSFVIGQMAPVALGHKNPKVAAAIVALVTSIVEAFGPAAAGVKPTLEIYQKMLEQTNPAIKSSAIAGLALLRQCLGPPVRDMLGSVKPALLSTIDAEFDKVANTPAPAPTRTCKAERAPKAKATRGGAAGKAGGASSSASSGAAGAGAAPSAELDLLPREDVSSKVGGQVLKDMSSAQWKERQEAMARVEQIIVAAGKRIQPNVAPLVAALKLRLGDSNKNLVATAASLCGFVLMAMGPGADRHLKTLLGPMLVLVGDNKPNVRTAAVEALDHVVSAVGLPVMIPHLPAAVAVESSLARQTLLSWMSKYAEQLRAAETDPSPLVKPLVTCLEDRTSDVRKLAEALLADVVVLTGMAPIKRAVKALKPASQQQVAPVLDKLAGGAGGASSTSTSSTTGPGAAGAGAAPTAASKAPSASNALKPPASPARRTGSAGSGLRAPRAVGKSESKPAKDGADKENQGPALSGGSAAAKESRARKAGKLPRQFEELHRDYAEVLREQLGGVVRSDLLVKMFKSEFKEHVEVMGELRAYVQSSVPPPAGFVNNLDLVLKWCALRLFDVNTTSLLKMIELLQGVCGGMEALEYQLSDHEAGVLLPVLIEKVGNNKEAVRSGLGGVLREMSKFLPPKQLFLYLLEGLRSKNARTRVEVLEQMARLVTDLGVDAVCVPSKALPAVGQYVAVNEKDVRGAAIALVVAFHAQLGDGVWRHLSKLSDKSRSMVEERLKHVSKGSGIPRPSKLALKSPSAASAPVKSPPRRLAFVESESSAEAGPVPSPVVAQPPPPQQQQQSAPSPAPSPSRLRQPSGSPTRRSAGAAGAGGGAGVVLPNPDVAMQAWDDGSWLGALGTDDDFVCVEAMKHVCWLAEHEDGELQRAMDTVLTHFGKHLARAGEAKTTLRRLRYIAHTIGQICDHAQLLEGVGQPVVADLLETIVTQLGEASVLARSDVGSVLRALNQALLKLVDNGPVSICFTGLLVCLQRSFEARSEEAKSAKALENLLKCILRLTKALPQTIERLDVDAVLAELHTFLLEHPPAAWKAKDDMPIRTVKTVLNELVKVLGTRIWGRLSRVPTESHPIIVSYIELLLKSNGAGAGAAKPRPEPVVAGGHVSGATTPEVLSPASQELKAQLATIFRRLGEASTREAGLRELREFRQAHPEVDIQPFLSRTSGHFQTQIREGLARLDGGAAPVAAGEEEARTPEMFHNRLRGLQERFGLSPSPVKAPEGLHAGAAGAAASVDVESIRERLRKAGSATDSAAAAPAAVEATAQGADAPSVDDIRDRLQRLRQSINLQK